MGYIIHEKIAVVCPIRSPISHQFEGFQIMIISYRNQCDFFFRFFYDWVVSYEQKVAPELPDEELTSGHVKAEVRRRLRLHRNLGEESVRIKPIETEEIGLYADIEFEGEKAEEILAEVYFSL